MKAFKVTFQHGHFIDKDTNQRIILVQGEEYIITASPDSFTMEDSILRMEHPLNSERKAIWADNEFGSARVVKIMDAGEQLFFRIGNSKMVPNYHKSNSIWREPSRVADNFRHMKCGY